MDRIQILLAEITKAYKLAHRDVPKLDEARLEAGLVASDTESIPVAYLQRSYAHARVYGRSSVPTSKDVMSAWDNAIHAEYVRDANKPVAIEYKPRHACEWCAVVALRLGGFVPDTTADEIARAKQPVTQKEIDCVRATLGKDLVILRYWNEKQTSPYYALL